ncbi:hypothetical protein K435DRAFT_808074 [Dendrothele bispora CBS 962.96]|uniref:Helitron helicase-like domain-containing protein n=1 Tax=Dendrothele bispora (strain CBS 962.96) TaxID=1314807 RepID=A0A4S8L318_DENBC|nr:hypothetical protein K435DRAFT_808074 [Dendrothele bispora CBS 962.96]
MVNIIQRKQTSFNAKLAVKRSLFPRVEALLDKAETEGEKAAADLLKNPGDEREMFSTVVTDGLPHIFLTLNPTDTNNPIAQVLAGRDLDLDKFFDDLKPGAENLEHSSSITLNPIAAAEFFHPSVKILLEILLLGTKRQNRKGIFGEVSVYYGVVEAQESSKTGMMMYSLIICLKELMSILELQIKIYEIYLRIQA